VAVGGCWAFVWRAAVVHARSAQRSSRVCGLSALACSQPQMRCNEAALGALIHNAAAVPALSALLDSATQPPPVRAAAARLLELLCSTRPEAISQAVASGCVPKLIQLVGSGAGGCPIAGAPALASITKAKEGKVAFLEVSSARVL
jgi:hypothetical protein